MFGLLACLLAAQPALPSDSVTSETVYYGGNLATFDVRTNELILLDSAWVRYGDMTVYADSIRYDVELHRLNALGDVLFTSGTQNMTGVEMQYDIDSRKGMMRTARTEIENGFFWAEEVWLVDEKTMNARKGYYTTCERIPPHYAFYGTRVKFFMDDIAIIQPVVFKVGNVPILAAPFWLIPVGTNRKSGLMPFKVGFSNEQGYYAKDLAYYLVINDYSDVTVYCDVMTRKGIQPKVEGVYIVEPYALGSVQGSYIEEWDTRLRRYSFNASHSSKKFFFGTEFKAQAEFQSDNSYAPEYAEDQIDWLKQDASSYAELSRRIGKVGRFSVVTEKKTDFARHYSFTRLPKALLSFGSHSLPLDWRIAPRLSFDNTCTDYRDSTDVDTANTVNRKASAGLGFGSPDYSLGSAGELQVTCGTRLTESRSYYNDTLDDHSRRLTGDVGLETSQKPFGIFNVYEDLTLEQSNNLVDTTLPETRYTASLAGDFQLFRVYGVETMGMHGLLHTARPRLHLSYEPEVTPGRVIGTPRISSPQAANLSLTLQNGFQAKVGSLKTKQDLGQVSFNTSYNLVDDHLSPLQANAELAPFRSVGNLRLRVKASAAFDFDSMDLKDNYSLSTSLQWNWLRARSSAPPGQPHAVSPLHHQPQRDWGIQLSLNHSFGKERNMVTGLVTILVPGWKATLNSIGYNFETDELTDYSISIWKELHCWEAIIDIDRLGSNWKYDFELRIRKLPDIKFGKSTFRTFLPE